MATFPVGHRMVMTVAHGIAGGLSRAQADGFSAKTSHFGALTNETFDVDGITLTIKEWAYAVRFGSAQEFLEIDGVTTDDELAKVNAANVNFAIGQNGSVATLKLWGKPFQGHYKFYLIPTDRSDDSNAGADAAAWKPVYDYVHSHVGAHVEATLVEGQSSKIQFYHNGKFETATDIKVYHNGAWVKPSEIKVWQNNAWVKIY